MASSAAPAASSVAVTVAGRGRASAAASVLALSAGPPAQVALGDAHAFAFDAVLPPSASQADVFRTVEPLVAAFLDAVSECLSKFSFVSFWGP